MQLPDSPCVALSFIIKQFLHIEEYLMLIRSPSTTYFSDLFIVLL